MAQHVRRSSLDFIPNRGIKFVVAEPQRPVPPLQPLAIRQPPRKLQQLGIIQQTPPDRFRCEIVAIGCATRVGFGGCVVETGGEEG